MIPPPITYIFRFAGGRTETVRLDFDDDMLLTRHSSDEPWTRLEENRCAHCPLPPGGACLFASALAPFIHRFGDRHSYETLTVEVVTPRRTFVAERDLQYALASLLGLVGATSGCPRLAFFRAISRMHLPFASDEEIFVRTFALHVMRDYLNGGVRTGVTGFLAEYDAAAKAYGGMIERLRNVFAHDAVVNGLVVLNTVAQMAPLVIRDRLVELTPAYGTATSLAPGPFPAS